MQTSRPYRHPETRAAVFALCLGLLAMRSDSAPPPGRIPPAWLQKAKGYEKALEAQRETGADIFVYFSRSTPDEAGLCRWFENRGLNHGEVQKYLRDYIKVTVPLPSNPDSQKLAEDFNVGKCPVVFIVQTNGWKRPCKVFDWPDGRPELLTPAELIQRFRERSGERYQTNSPSPAPTSEGLAVP